MDLYLFNPRSNTHRETLQIRSKRRRVLHYLRHILLNSFQTPLSDQLPVDIIEPALVTGQPSDFSSKMFDFDGQILQKTRCASAFVQWSGTVSRVRFDICVVWLAVRVGAGRGWQLEDAL